MTTEIDSPKLAPSSAAIPHDERVFFEIIGPAIAKQSLLFFCDGRRYAFGAEAERTTVRIKDPRFFAQVLTHGNLGLGEAYMDEKFEMVNGTLEDFLLALARSNVEQFVRRSPRNILKLAGIYVRNLWQGRYINVQSHYDIGDDLFESFLDSSMAYSCGYQKTTEDSLAQLQINKFDRICQKLRIRSGDTLLDIGCGFGGLLIHAATHYGARCTGITIAKHHHQRGREIVEKKGLSDRIDIRFASHQGVYGKFDKVVSVGMMEHLRRRDYPVYIRNIKRSLNEAGMGLIHCIGCNNYKNKHDPFIQKYVFPGSGQPRLSEISYYLEKNQLPILDVENMARHYAPTAHAWLVNFQRNYENLDHNKYNERFKRMWEYYLSCGVPGAMATDSALYQVLFSNDYAIEIPFQRV